MSNVQQIEEVDSDCFDHDQEFCCAHTRFVDVLDVGSLRFCVEDKCLQDEWTPVLRMACSKQSSAEVHSS